MSSLYLYQRAILLCCFILIANNVIGQDALTKKLAGIAVQHTNSGILIGQKIPDLFTYKTVNYSKDNISLGNFKHKLIILDFWNQYCSSCLAQFPKLEHLQEKFENSILIMPVTFQSRKSVQDFFYKRKRENRPICLPSIIEDTVLRKFFPHDGDPYEVWIKDMTVIGITNQFAVTDTVIRQILDSNYLTIRRLSLDPAFDVTKPFLINGNGGNDSDYIYHSILTEKNNRLRPDWYFHSDSNYLRIFVSNYPAIQLLKKAFFQYFGTKYEYLRNDPLNKRVIITPELASNLTNSYCYDLILPGNFSYKDGFGFMLDNLQLFFKTKVAVQVRKVNCLLLVQSNSKKEMNVLKDTHKSGSHRKFHTTTDLARYLNAASPLPLILDRTNQIKDIDMTINKKSIFDLSTLKSILNKHGLNIVKADVKIPMIVFQSNLPENNTEK